MPRQKLADKVEALRRQQAELAAKIKEAEAAERQKRREDDRRRQDVAGRVALILLDQQPEGEFARLFRAALADQVRGPADRVLFEGLPPLPAEEMPAKRGRPARTAPPPATEAAPAGSEQAA